MIYLKIIFNLIIIMARCFAKLFKGVVLLDEHHRIVRHKEEDTVFNVINISYIDIIIFYLVY